MNELKQNLDLGHKRKIKRHAEIEPNNFNFSTKTIISLEGVAGFTRIARQTPVK